MIVTIFYVKIIISIILFFKRIREKSIRLDSQVKMLGGQYEKDHV